MVRRLKEEEYQTNLAKWGYCIIILISSTSLESNKKSILIELGL